MKLSEEQKKRIWKMCQIDGTGVLPKFDFQARVKMYQNLIDMFENVPEEEIYRPPIFSTITAFNTGILRTSKDVNWDIEWDKDVPNLETPPEKEPTNSSDNSNNLK